MAKNNIIAATEELVRELEGDVPRGETPPAHNRGHSYFPRGGRSGTPHPLDRGGKPRVPPPEPGHRYLWIIKSKPTVRVTPKRSRTLKPHMETTESRKPRSGGGRGGGVNIHCDTQKGGSSGRTFAVGRVVVELEAGLAQAHERAVGVQTLAPDAHVASAALVHV